MASFTATKRPSRTCLKGLSRHYACNGVVTLLAFFAALTWTAKSDAKPVDRVAAVVNGEVILESDIDSFVKKAQSKSFRELYGGLDAKVGASRGSAMQLMIEEKILDQQVKKLDLGASPQDIDGQIRTVLRRNHITQPQLAERLKQLGTPMDEYRLGLKRQLERRALVDREIKPQLNISEEQLRHFYERSRNKEGAHDGLYKIADIFIAHGDDKKKAEKRARGVYDAAKNAPEAFAALAKESSDDQQTALNGGVLGEFQLSSLSPEYRKAITKTKVGGISEPVTSEKGWHIVKVLSYLPAGYGTLTPEQKDQLRGEFTNQEVERRMSAWMDRKRQEAYIRFVEPLAKTKAAPAPSAEPTVEPTKNAPAAKESSS